MEIRVAVTDEAVLELSLAFFARIVVILQQFRILIVALVLGDGISEKFFEVALMLFFNIDYLGRVILCAISVHIQKLLLFLGPWITAIHTPLHPQLHHILDINLVTPRRFVLARPLLLTFESNQSASAEIALLVTTVLGSFSLGKDGELLRFLDDRRDDLFGV